MEMKMLKDLTIHELQNILGESVRLQKKLGGYLAQAESGICLGLPYTMLLEDNGALLCPGIDLSPEAERQIRDTLYLSDGVHSIELFVGSYQGGVFRLSQTGKRASHTVVSLYYRVDITGEDDMRDATAAFLDEFHPLQSVYQPARNCLAQSQHIIKTPRSLRATMGVGLIGSLRQFLQQLRHTMERNIASRRLSRSA